ncbi:MAG: pyrroline-5-carboxylate reductase [Planctomycetaceae bacterium]
MNSTPFPRPRIALIGGGRMGRALIDGMARAAVLDLHDVAVVEPDENSRRWWKENLPDCRHADSVTDAIRDTHVALLAVKPDVVQQAATGGSGHWQERLVISVAAGISLAQLTQWLGSERVIRVMPNTPCLVGAGASAYCCAPGVTKQDRQLAASMLSAVGWAGEVDEKQMDAVTGLSGSGPAYVCVAIEALADGGVMAGLPRDLALRLATQTMLGTAQLVAQTGQHPAALKDAVASPGGTTIAGLRALEQNGVRAALIEAVVAATNRSRELGSR